VTPVRLSLAIALAALVMLLPTLAAAAPIKDVKGTPTADRIDVVFGGTTQVTCGKGVDVVTADAADKIARDCEFISRRISVDTLTSAPGQHQTEVEPSVAGWGSKAVAAFQVGRFRDGGAAGIGWATSADRGRTWRSGVLPGVTTASSPPGEAPRASDPAVAYDAAHGTWLVSSLVLGVGFSGVGISRSADGMTWSAPVFAARFTANALAYDKEWSSCDNTTTSRFFGSCYLVYTDFTAAPRIALQTSRDGGLTWSAPVTVTSSFGGDAVGALPLIQPDGAVTVVLEASETGVYAVRSTDGGSTFAAPVGISSLRFSQQPLLRAPPLPAASVDSSGRIYVVWSDCAFRPACDGNTIILTTSTDGSTWSPLRRVPGTGFDSFVPAIAADPSAPGHIGIVSYVRTSNACSASTCSVGAAFVRSADGGTTWTKPQRLDGKAARYSWLANAGGHFLGDYIGATYAGGRFVPVLALASPPVNGGVLREYMLSASIA
jgi:hypothetical protein